jgi:hypothetical protein
MAQKTFQTRVVWVGPDIPEEDLGEKLITIENIIGDRGFFAHFEHEGQTVSGSAEISPHDWEQTGVTPTTVRVADNRVDP